MIILKLNFLFRKAESKEEVKTAIDSLEKDALLLDLIPIAFNEELESNVLTLKRLIQSTSFGTLSQSPFDSMVNQRVCSVAILQSTKDWIIFLDKTLLCH